MADPIKPSISSDRWREVSNIISALIEGEEDTISKMATISCELFNSFDHFDWVGFYRVVEPNLLKVGPYQGGHGCLVIPFSKGVCGAAARLQKTQLVPNVNAITDHIACSSTTQSEIVLPVIQNGNLIAVLDIDSDLPDVFTTEDQQALETILSKAF